MNRRSLLLSAGALTLAGCASSSPVRAREHPLATEFDAAVAQVMALNVSPGLAFAVFTADGTYARGLGVTDLETGERADADTAFYIASSTKPLTALALTKLHHRGAFNLDMTLAEYAPDAPFPAAVRANEVRFRNMLSHTSGIDNGPIGYRSAFSGQHDPATLWRLLAESEVNADAPLGTFDYTNVGYNIATVLTDRGLGVQWQDLLDREVFAPLGMIRTSARMSRAVAAGWRVAKPHEALPSPERVYLEKTDQTMQSAGGVILSANDALRWLEAMVRGGQLGSRQVIAPEVIAATREPLAQTSGDMMGFDRTTYGLGWFSGDHRGTTIYHHFGGFAGFAAHVSYMPERGVGVAVLSNGGGLGNVVIHTLADYVYNRTGHDDADARFADALEQRRGLIEQFRARGAADRANRASREWRLSRERAAYAGTYESEAWGRIEVEARGSDLIVQYGVMRATAEPFTQPDSIRVELVPGTGEPIQFLGEGEQPSGLRTRGGAFERV
ncbi:MAG: serine hydrolase domain-containing protein [Hyphomonadaceae bacterium]